MFVILSGASAASEVEGQREVSAANEVEGQLRKHCFLAARYVEGPWLGRANDGGSKGYE